MPPLPCPRGHIRGSRLDELSISSPFGKCHVLCCAGEDYDDDDFVDALPSLEMVHELPEHKDHVTGIVWTSSEAVATSSNDGTGGFKAVAT